MTWVQHSLRLSGTRAIQKEPQRVKGRSAVQVKIFFWAELQCVLRQLNCTYAACCARTFVLCILFWPDAFHHQETGLMPSAENYRADLVTQLVRENERVATTVLEGVRSGNPEKIEGRGG